MSKSDKALKIVTAGIMIVFVFGIKTNTAQAPGSQNITTHYSLPTTHLFFAGDIMLSRHVAGKIMAAGNLNLPFEKTASETSHADLAFANLESPFLDKAPYAQQGLVFKADPQTVQGLNFAGFDVLSTSNNHALDQGISGLDFTINHLLTNKIIPVGTFSSTAPTPDQPQNVITKNNIAFGFLSYSYSALNDGGKIISPLVADYNDLEKLSQDIWTLKGHFADVVIVNMHAGVEYTREPNQKQIAFAHAAIDAGADLVVGAHPHWIQTIEQYQGKWIFYSLGNFVFDQMWSADTKEGLTLLITFQDHAIKKIELKPVIIDDYCCPRFANSDETALILSKIGLTDPILMNNN